MNLNVIFFVLLFVILTRCDDMKTTKKDTNSDTKEEVSLKTLVTKHLNDCLSGIAYDTSKDGRQFNYRGTNKYVPYGTRPNENDDIDENVSDCMEEDEEVNNSRHRYDGTRFNKRNTQRDSDSYNNRNHRTNQDGNNRDGSNRDRNNRNRNNNREYGNNREHGNNQDRNNKSGNNCGENDSEEEDNNENYGGNNRDNRRRVNNNRRTNINRNNHGVNNGRGYDYYDGNRGRFPQQHQQPFGGQEDFFYRTKRAGFNRNGDSLEKDRKETEENEQSQVWQF